MSSMYIFETGGPDLEMQSSHEYKNKFKGVAVEKIQGLLDSGVFLTPETLLGHIYLEKGENLFSF